MKELFFEFLNELLDFLPYILLVTIVVLLLERIRRRYRRAIQSSAKRWVNPADSGGQVYQFGTSNLTTDIPILSFTMLTIASLALGGAFIFFVDIFNGYEGLGFYLDPKWFWTRSLVLSLIFMLVLAAWSRAKMDAYQKSLGKEIVTTSTGVQFSVFLDMEWRRLFFRILKREGYLGFQWEQISEWRVVRTWYPSSEGGYWVQEYQITTQNNLYVLHREPLLGLEEPFLEEVRGRIGEKLKIEDALVAES